MTRIADDSYPRDRSAFDEFIKATTAIGSIVAGVLFTMTLAGANVVRPPQSVDPRQEASDCIAHEGFPAGSGTFSGYQILY